MVAKKSQTARTRPGWLVPGLATILVAAIVTTGLELTNVTHFLHTSPAADNRPTPAELEQEAQANSQKKQQGVEHPVTGTPSPAPASSSISLTARQEAGGTVTVMTNLGNVADGTCQLTVVNGSTTKSYTADVIYQPQYSVCAGFSVPVSDVGAGTWTLTLSATSAGATANKTITMEVR